MSNQFAVVCGNCEVPPELGADADGEVVICAQCGQRDSFEDAQRIAGEHFLEPDRGARWHASPL